MANLLDYLRWRGDLSFQQDPFNEVDNLLLTQLVFLNFHGIVPEDSSSPVSLEDAAGHFFSLERQNISLGVLVPDEIVELFRLMAKSRRFSDSRLSFFSDRLDEARQEQFCAITVDLPDGSSYLSFRGTDDTIVGWRENFNLGYQFPIPAQQDAAKYVRRTAASRPAVPLRLGGHSKGGNLAIYAAVYSPPALQAQIIAVYNNDGPGFRRRLQEQEEYRRIQDRIHTIVPQSSVVGMLLEHAETYEVVRSTQTGLMQHDGFSWEVLGSSFVHLDRVTDHCQYVDRSLKDWVDAMDDNAREQLVEALFQALDSAGVKTLTDLTEDKLRSARILLGTLSAMDKETRDRLGQILPLFFPPLQLPKLF